MMNPRQKPNKEIPQATKGKRPEYTGIVQDNSRNKTGEIALWITAEKRNENFPDITGTLTVNDGTKYRIAIWKRGIQ